jgi:hypothetical protein
MEDHVTDRWNDASPEAQNLASNFDEIDLAEMLVTAQAAIERVTDLQAQWLAAGPPPLGVPLARWWDARLVELHKAIHEGAEQSARTTVKNLPVHIGGRANAEDCPACKGTNPDYPFICPGPDAEHPGRTTVKNPAGA